MWSKLIGWWEMRTRGKELRGPLPIQLDVLRDRHSRAEVQVMSIVAFLLAVPLLIFGYVYFFGGNQRAEQDLADGTRMVSPGHYEEGIMLLTKALDKLGSSHPNRYMGYLMRGTAYHMVGERQKSTDDLVEAIRLRPDCGRCYTERAGVERELKQYSEALEDLDRAQPIENTPDIHYDRAMIYEETNQPAKAIEEYSKAISMRDGWPHMYRARAKLRKQVGDMTGYEEDKQMVIRLTGGW